MIWKVCGMRDTQNIKEVLSLKPDYMGFIFYASSPRNIENILDENLLLSFPKSTQKVGVFVDAETEFILGKMKQYHLDVVQLHGNESSARCAELKAMGFKVIKAFGINEGFKWELLTDYQQAVDYFLFDAKGKKQGGNGIAFDWDLLSNYKLKIPYFLSGGLSIENLQDLKTKNLPQLYAVDVNSKFEIEPGIKNINKLKTLKQNFI